MKYISVRLRDGSWWGVPLDIVARDRAKHYAHEFDGDIERSLKEDTWPLFEESEYDAIDWAVGNMNWSDFKGHEIKIKEPLPLTDNDFNESWLSEDKEIIEFDAT